MCAVRCQGFFGGRADQQQPSRRPGRLPQSAREGAGPGRAIPWGLVAIKTQVPGRFYGAKVVEALLGFEVAVYAQGAAVAPSG